MKLTKRSVLNLAVFSIILMTAGCGGSGDSFDTKKTPVEWTWVSGSDTTDQKGTYGTLGTGSASNIPGAREKGISWIDASGSLWLFGGYGLAKTSDFDRLNDLWKYEPSTGEWTWVSGSDTINQKGTYGTQGTGSESNVPGAREGSISWRVSGSLWLFGGIGYNLAGTSANLNDLWKYEPSTGEWTWVSGSDTGNQTGTYGTLGTGSESNIPGSRYSSISWTDSSGNLWLFGGEGYDTNGNYGWLNDLWKYKPSTGEWTWVSGSNTRNQKGTYGTQGTGDESNIPGARDYSISWADLSGNLWLFGGSGYDKNGNFGNLNDLWKYEPSTGEWTWVSGSDTRNQEGTYGTKGTGSTSNVPGARYSSISWIDTSGSLWLFGGEGYDSGSYSENDLWKYEPSTGEWTWVSGSDTTDQNGTYGTLGTGSTSNIPGARYSGISWIDSSGSLWLFGGSGYDSSGSFSELNDLWKYKP